MKNTFWGLISLVLLYSCSGGKGDGTNFRINGTISGDYEGMVYLLTRESGSWVRHDSTQTSNGAFLFRGFTEMPEVRYIGSKDLAMLAQIFVEPGELTFTTNADGFNATEIEGSASQREYDHFSDLTDAYDLRMEEAWNNAKEAGEKGDKAYADKWMEEYKVAQEEQRAFVLDYCKENNTSVVSAYILLRNSYYYDENDLEPVVGAFSPSIANSVYVKKLRERVEALKRVAVGQPAIDFTMNDTAGNPVALSSLFGKYLLVDFWASWCGPCRVENPNIVAVYNDFHDRGFDVLGVSFDRDKGKWLQAIADDRLTWMHVSDLAYWNNAAGKLYAVNSIPSSVLLDPEGIIIARNLKGDDLRAKMEDLLGKK